MGYYLMGAVVLLLFLFFVVLPALPVIGGVIIVGLLGWNIKLKRDRRRLEKRLPNYLK